VGELDTAPGPAAPRRVRREEERGPPERGREAENEGKEEWNQDQENTSNLWRNTSKLGGRLRWFVDRWESTCGGGLLLKRGFEIWWVSARGKSLIERFGPKRRECWQSGENRAAMREAVSEAVEKEIIQEIPKREVMLSSPSYVVPKAKGGFRQVLDLRLLNSFTQEISFKMEDTTLLMQTARPGDFGTSIDIKSAFNHIPTNPSAFRFLTFSLDGRAYAWRGMPFGAKHAPLVFTKIMRVVLGYIRKRWNVRCIGYMDDLLFLHQDKEELRKMTDQIAEYLRWIGWVLSDEKCEMEPAQRIVFLGWQWDFEKMEVSMKKERRKTLMELMRKWIAKCRQAAKVNNRDLASLMGKLNFLRTQFPRIGLYLTSLNRAKVRGVKKTGWKGKTRVTFAQEAELRVIYRWIQRNSPRDFQMRTPEATLITDACKEGWGASLVTERSKLLYHGKFETLAPKLTSSNQRETAAVLLALKESQQTLRREHVHCICIESDNTTTVSNLGKKRGARTMVRMVRKIFRIAEMLDMEIQARYRPGVDNQVADALSRLEGAGDYALKQTYFESGLKNLRKPEEQEDTIVEIDMFATDGNAKLRRFVAPSPHPNAEACDAFSISWQQIRVYAHPPIRMIAKTILKIELERVEAVLVVPNWPTQVWWPRLMQLKTKIVTLGKGEEVLEAGEWMKRRGTKLPPGELLMVRISWD
jgi:hypothetical protein